MAGSNTIDVLIAGGGIAGLTAAAYLSKSGMKTLLCEKEKKTGGLVNSFEFKGFVFDGGIRSLENLGIIIPMLKQLGIKVDFIKSAVSVGIGKDVVRILSKENLSDYQALLNKHFPENTKDINAIIHEVAKIMGYMDILYGIDNPMFLDLKSNPKYVLKTILPWLFKYLLTMGKIKKFNAPVEKYLAGLTGNQPLIDLIAQHFFQKTPAFFALSYFSLYLDYLYPRGGTGSLPDALAKFVIANQGEIRTGVEIVRVLPGENKAIDAQGNVYIYKKLLWAADLKTLYRIIDLDSIKNRKVIKKIQARKQILSGKTGGDSVFTLNLTLNLDKNYFSSIASEHFFYTPSLSGLSQVPLQELKEKQHPQNFKNDKILILAWLRRFLELNTYEISCPVLRDEALAPAGKTGLIISVLFEYSLTKHIKEMGWYDEFREFMTNCIIDILDAAIYPGIKKAVIDSFNSTPLSIEKISGNSEGAITGWAFTNPSIPAVSKIHKVPKSVLTPIPNVFQAGQWTYSPSGLPISILSGKLASDQILKELK